MEMIITKHHRQIIRRDLKGVHIVCDAAAVGTTTRSIAVFPVATASTRTTAPTFWAFVWFCLLSSLGRKEAERKGKPEQYVCRRDRRLEQARLRHGAAFRQHQQDERDSASVHSATLARDMRQSFRPESGRIQASHRFSGPTRHSSAEAIASAHFSIVLPSTTGRGDSQSALCSIPQPCYARGRNRNKLERRHARCLMHSPS